MLDDPDYLKLKDRYVKLEEDNRELKVRLTLREGEILRLREKLEQVSSTARFEAQIGAPGNGG